MACMAISSWSWQSQRSDPSTSPVMHCEWIRSNGTPSVTSPMTSASAVSTRRVPFEISRSYPTASNMPHLVGMRADATRQSVSVCTALIDFSLVSGMRKLRHTHAASRPYLRVWTTLCRAFPCLRSGTARAQAVDLARVEAKLFENLFVVLSKCWSASRRHFRHAMHLNWTADRRGQLATGAFERNDDVVRAQLR